MNAIQKFIGHIQTVQRHRTMVCKLCFKCGLYWQGLTHDLSKYSPAEFINGVRFYTGTCSPHVSERKKLGYSKAWLHHKGHNKHHSDYWQDIMPDNKVHPIDMPEKYFLEMICDRVAASMIYLKDKYTDKAPLEYYLSNKDEHQFSDATRTKLENYLRNIAEKGFKETMENRKEK